MKIRHLILPTLTALLLAAGSFVISVEHWFLRDLKFDDAWIHLRYASNLAMGKGFVFNEGERVLGSAGILWNLILALFARVFSIDSLPTIVTVLNGLALLACAAVLVIALEGIVPRWHGLLTAAILLSYGPLAVSSIGGMETTFLCLLYFLAFLMLKRGKFVVAGLCAGTALGFRPESASLMAAALLSVWLYSRKDLRKTLLATLVVPTAVLGWSWWYFGSPIANSTLAKKIVYIAAPGASSSWCIQSLSEILPFYRIFPRAHIDVNVAALLGFCITVAAGIFGYLRLRDKAPASSVIGIQAIAPFVFYSLAKPLMFSWYDCTFVPIATILLLLGLFEICRRLFPLRPLFADVLTLTLILFFAISPVRNMWRTLTPPDDPHFSYYTPNARENARTYLYVKVARWLNAQTKETDRVCISEIGALGYFYHGRILDGVGLVSPEALKFHPVPLSMRPDGYVGVIAPGVVRTYRPEYVVSLDHFAEALFRDTWFLDNYAEIGRWDWFSGPVRWRDLPPLMWGGSKVYAFRRR